MPTDEKKEQLESALPSNPAGEVGNEGAHEVAFSNPTSHAGL